MADKLKKKRLVLKFQLDEIQENKFSYKRKNDYSALQKAVNEEKEIKNNGILQQKAVKYLNKAKIRYFHQTQYLEFQYHKFGVDSVAKLEMYYNRYLKNKNNERLYLQMNDSLNEIEEDILKILHNKDILLGVWTGYDKPVKDANTYFDTAKNKLNIPVNTTTKFGGNSNIMYEKTK